MFVPRRRTPGSGQVLTVTRPGSRRVLAAGAVLGVGCLGFGSGPVPLQARAAAAAQSSPTLEAATAGPGMYGVFETSVGTFACALEFEKTPVTVASFVGLAEGRIQFLDPSTQEWVTRPFYDGLKFHRVRPDFLIQGGDPLGDGTGGPGYAFIDEFRADLRHDRPGIVSMANSGPGTNGSQFFITLKKLAYLDGRHTVFGHVVYGYDVVERISRQPTAGPDGTMPAVDVVLRKLSILRRGRAAESFDAPAAFARQDEIMAQRELERQATAARFRAELDQQMAAAVATASGMRYIVRETGEGTEPQPGELVKIHYVAYLEDGTKFDSSYDREVPHQFPVGKGHVIRGLDELILTMRPGERRRVVLPPALGYGDHGAKRFGIPPNAVLVFEVELVEVLRR